MKKFVIGALLCIQIAHPMTSIDTLMPILEQSIQRVIEKTCSYNLQNDCSLHHAMLPIEQRKDLAGITAQYHIRIGLFKKLLISNNYDSTFDDNTQTTFIPQEKKIIAQATDGTEAVIYKSKRDKADAVFYNHDDQELFIYTPQKFVLEKKLKVLKNVAGVYLFKNDLFFNSYRIDAEFFCNEKLADQDDTIYRTPIYSAPDKLFISSMSLVHEADKYLYNHRIKIHKHDPITNRYKFFQVIDLEDQATKITGLAYSSITKTLFINFHPTEENPPYDNIAFWNQDEHGRFKDSGFSLRVPHSPHQITLEQLSVDEYGILQAISTGNDGITALHRFEIHKTDSFKGYKVFNLSLLYTDINSLTLSQLALLVAIRGKIQDTSPANQHAVIPISQIYQEDYTSIKNFLSTREKSKLVFGE